MNDELIIELAFEVRVHYDPSVRQVQISGPFYDVRIAESVAADLAKQAGVIKIEIAQTTGRIVG